MIGLVPIGVPIYKEQSAKTVFPLVIANCAEKRYLKLFMINTFAPYKFNKLDTNGIYLSECITKWEGGSSK